MRNRYFLIISEIVHFSNNNPTSDSRLQILPSYQQLFEYSVTVPCTTPFYQQLATHHFVVSENLTHRFGLEPAPVTL
jgi:hypothetical protein